MEKPTPERLREMLDYSPDTGDLTWKVPRPHIRRGDEAGVTTNRGHIMLSVDGCRLAATQAIWAMVHGEYPARRIQHRDKDPQNLELDNLTLYRELPPDRSREAVKASLLKRVNADAFAAIQRDHTRWADYMAATPLGQRRMLAAQREELRLRYPSHYPSDHLMRLGRKRKTWA